MRYIRHSTQTDVLIGPVISDTDFKTVKTDLAYNAAGIDVDVFKNATKVDVTLANSAGDGYWRYSDHGFYVVTLSTTDTNTVGRLKFAFAATGYLLAWSDYTVLSAVVYDALIAGTDNFDVNVISMATDTVTADALKTDAVTEVVNAINSLATYGLAALNTLLVTTGIKATSVPNVTLAETQGSYAPAKAGDKMDIVDAPSATGVGVIVTAVWAKATSALTTTGSIGKRLLEFITTLVYAAPPAAAPTAADNATAAAAAILATPANKLVTNASGQVVASNAGAVDLSPVEDALADIVDGTTPIAHVTLVDTTTDLTNKGSVAGAGSDSVTLSLGPLASGAEVWVSTDAAGRRTIASGTANDSGSIAFWLDSGSTYYRWAKKPGVNFANPAEFVAVAD